MSFSPSHRVRPPPAPAAGPPISRADSGATGPVGSFGEMPGSAPGSSPPPNGASATGELSCGPVPTPSPDPPPPDSPPPAGAVPGSSGGKSIRLIPKSGRSPAAGGAEYVGSSGVLWPATHDGGRELSEVAKSPNIGSGTGVSGWLSPRPVNDGADVSPPAWPRP